MIKLLSACLLSLVFLATPVWSADGKTQVSQVTLMTNQGDIVIELNAEKAPLSVKNFLDYVNHGDYEGTIFHRVIPGFMAQGGGFTTSLQQRPTQAPIKNEADNGLKNLRGTIAMARTNDPHSATSQFFINLVDNDFLDHKEKSPRGWGYAVFGKVVSGMEVVDKIAEIPTGARGPFRSDVPQTNVVIVRAKAH